MGRRSFDIVVIGLMVASGVYVAATGLIADAFGLHQFVFHRYAGYLCVGFTLLHVVLNWQQLLVGLRALVPWRDRTASPRRRRPRGGSPTVERRELLVAALSAAGGLLAGWLIPDRRRALPDGATDIGELYHEWSTPGHTLDLPAPNWGRRTPVYKTYPDASRIALPQPAGFEGITVEQGLEARRSVRDYGREPLSLEMLSGLLQAAQGITEERLEFRAAPSAGALYPIELYPVAHSVTGLASGVYHYAVRPHELECLEQGDFRGEVTRAGLYQSFLGQAAVCFILSAVFQRSRWKYRERAYRYVLLEAGHIGQNLYLAAASMGLGACAVGAFQDDQFNRLLGLERAEEAVLYVISVGPTPRS